ncbi:MAG: M16 family metallopeptidase [Smithellaceae bacterium]
MKRITVSLCLKLVFWLVIFISIQATSVAAVVHLPAPDNLRYPPLHFNLPDAERIVLDNGIVLYIMEDHELPLVSINALIKTGTMYDPSGKEGVAELTAYLMKTGGTQKLTSSEIDNQFDFMAASPAITVSLDSAQIDFSLLNKDIDQGLDLLSQILITPAFEQNKFDLARGLKNEELRRLKDDPQRLAVREFNRLIYRDNPRGRFSSGKSLKNIERADLIKFHRNFFQPQNIMFAVTGDINREEAVSKIKRYFGNWQSRGNFVNPPAPPRNSPAGLFYIDKDIPQSTIITGQLSPGKNNPDFYAFTVLDFIIGSGGFPSRIFSAIRNNEGLAYSAGSFYRAKSDHGVFAAYAFTKTESTCKTLSLMESVLNNVQADTITTQEIEWAKRSINNGFIFSFTSPEQIAWQQMKLEYDHLPADFLSSYRNKIENIQVDDLQKIAGRYLDKKNTNTLILGNSKKFGKILTGKGLPVLITPIE